MGKSVGLAEAAKAKAVCRAGCLPFAVQDGGYLGSYTLLTWFPNREIYQSFGSA